MERSRLKNLSTIRSPRTLLQHLCDNRPIAAITAWTPWRQLHICTRARTLSPRGGLHERKGTARQSDRRMDIFSGPIALAMQLRA
ncbi:hypothetical protein BAUCODRAFT_436535 [Baudoinia panamericana UAMH 10762]|uniref:Uncharacterized protein n=1 Tax=Baudoinia panamericana (strain UAMH 10762) TaxID=717646 RepID=M2MK41_BAUPA|nr:uncharacterized protein BAUCODRAFT_436535 [Baudoinia panamericana UAMH 10762]EMC97056.1 hypothetical protein BAUCODRAFT_436535 [Baudoinia panamericana UAMH 10762]